MTNTAEQTALAAERTIRNTPGMCLQQSRIWADIPAKYPDATTAWLNTNDRHPGDRSVPRGAMAYWVGGSAGHGHVGPGLGGRGSLIRSTDAGGTGIVATRDLAWFARNWPSLRYAGWAWDINEVTIPHPEEDEMQAEDWIKMRAIAKQEAEAAVRDNNPVLVDLVWGKMISVTKPDGGETNKSTKQVIRETWQRIAKKL